MSEFFKSFAEWTQKRATTAIIGTYSAFWLLQHWQALYVTLFVNEQKVFDKFGMLKNEYINHYFLTPRLNDPYYYAELITPFLATWLFIWVLPRMLFLPAFEKEREYKSAKRIIIYRNEGRIESAKAKLANAKSSTLEAEKEVITKEIEVNELDPTKLDKMAYSEFMKGSKSSKTLADIIEARYNHGGKISKYWVENDRHWVDYTMPKDSLARADSNGLIILNDKAETIDLTDKGRYFVSEFEKAFPDILVS